MTIDHTMSPSFPERGQVTERAKPNRGYVASLAAAAAVGGFLFGFDTSTLNSAIAGVRNTLQLSAGAVGFVAAIALIGCAVGAWFAGPISSRLGRGRVMCLAGLAIAVASTVTFFVNHVLLLGLCRFVVGLGIGAASAVVPAYISELAPPQIRGRLGSFWQFAIVFGQLLGLLAGFGLTAWAGSEAAPMPWGWTAWRTMFLVVGVLGAVYVLIARKLPQTPPDLIRRGRVDEARALLERIGYPEIDEEIAAIEQTQAGQQRSVRLKDLRGPCLGLRPIVWTGLMLGALQQLVGISAVKTYSNTLWQAVGFSTGASFTISIFTVLLSIASTGVAIALIDKVGRRALLLTGAAVMAVASGGLAIALATATGSGADLTLGREAAIAALIAINLFAVAFGVSWGPVMWVVLAELFDSNLRTSAVAVCTAVNWLTNWVVTRTHPPLAGAGLGFAYGLFAAFAVVAFLFALKLLPETGERRLS